MSHRWHPGRPSIKPSEEDRPAPAPPNGHVKKRHRGPDGPESTRVTSSRTGSHPASQAPGQPPPIRESTRPLRLGPRRGVACGLLPSMSLFALPNDWGWLPLNAGTSVERMVFFSDAVFAIALTLLALDLKLPEGIPAEQLDSALVAAWPQLLAYALSFVIIAETWMSHHSDFALIRRFNVNLAWLNLALLFFIAMLPCSHVRPQRLRGRSTPWPSILYAANIAAVYLMLAAIWGYARHAGLMDPEMAAHVHRHSFYARMAVPLVFLLRSRPPSPSTPTRPFCGCCSCRRHGCRGGWPPRRNARGPRSNAPERDKQRLASRPQGQRAGKLRESPRTSPRVTPLLTRMNVVARAHLVSPLSPMAVTIGISPTRLSLRDEGGGGTGWRYLSSYRGTTWNSSLSKGLGNTTTNRRSAPGCSPCVRQPATDAFPTRPRLALERHPPGWNS